MLPLPIPGQEAHITIVLEGGLIFVLLKGLIVIPIQFPDVNGYPLSGARLPIPLFIYYHETGTH